MIQAEGENTEFCNKACFRTEHIRKHAFAIRGCRLKQRMGGDKNCFLFGIATDCKANAKRQNCGKNQGNDYQSILAE